MIDTRPPIGPQEVVMDGPAIAIATGLMVWALSVAVMLLVTEVVNHDPGPPPRLRH